jgi:hypothetical protein
MKTCEDPIEAEKPIGSILSRVDKSYHLEEETSVRGSVWQGEAMLDNRWTDILESPQAKAIRNGKLDFLDIYNLFDKMEREILLHRERFRTEKEDQDIRK